MILEPPRPDARRLHPPRRCARQQARGRPRHDRARSRRTVARPTPSTSGRASKFGPPVNRPVTSKDILYAIQRLGNPKDGAQYAFYYSVIKGFDDFIEGQGEDDLRHPYAEQQHDHLRPDPADGRLPLPDWHARSRADPAEVGKCFDGVAEKYGRDLISSGPYMIQGEGAIDISSCDKLQPISGYDPTVAASRSSATRTYSKASDRVGRPREQSRTRSSSRSTRTPTTSTRRSRTAISRTRSRQRPAARSCRSTRRIRA